MTKLAKRKTRLQFETSDIFRHRPVIVEADAYLARIRLKGTRTRFEISWGAIYTAAAKLETARRLKEYRAKRAKRRTWAGF